MNQSDFLVKPSVAAEQLEREAERRRGNTEGSGGDRAGLSGLGGETATGAGTGTGSAGGPSFASGGGAAGGIKDTPAGDGAKQTMPTSFAMSARLDNTRVIQNMRSIVEEVVSQLDLLDGADIELTFEVKAHVATGIPVPSQRAISENCRTLHIGDYRFDGWPSH